MDIAITFLFAVSIWVIFHAAVRRLRKPLVYSFSAATVLFLWFFAVTFLSKTRFFAINPLVAPNIMLGFLVLFMFLQKAYASKRIRTITDVIPQHWLIGIQTYRVVGVNFLFLYQAGVLPAAFAFPSGYGDILVGVTAPFIAYFCFKKKPFARRVAIAWNILGILDLVMALGIGTLGFPRPLQMLPLTPSTEPLSLHPLALIPLFAVPLALMLHLFSLRTLVKRSNAI
ncbi:MAG: hypothetical protein Q8R20_03180 [Nanoarchaeota archaeon]|nr:hypothetical protein [Nanoarchaeota archaeon]